MRMVTIEILIPKREQQNTVFLAPGTGKVREKPGNNELHGGDEETISLWLPIGLSTLYLSAAIAAPFLTLIMFVTSKTIEATAKKSLGKRRRKKSAAMEKVHIKRYLTELNITFRVNLDYTLRVDVSATLTVESSIEQTTTYEKWEGSNCISPMIMKGFIMIAIRGAISDLENANMYLVQIEEQFQDSSKAHATTFITKMIMLKYSKSSCVREHILRIDDMAFQLNGLDMKISKDFIVLFIRTSFPVQFGPLKINHNTQKEK
ncbi:hypothetical protein RJ639_045877 [Escallonia herrerae]|uniref:Uncharacterized protein n=1 Tax=Escallonia herrerae TaxID=1293975 RepID=A0AA89AZ95_9ASTE|nr:hypothetical protein RJ639_045877 [Escallonia herrerae]